ncbi:MAG: hypothetical protein GY793_11570 [Proteobacteria bacterium]|nr:hypothetical protein [Pseudomonadota bacterium]
MKIKNTNYSGIFNVNSLPKLNSDDRKAVKEAELVLIFDNDTPADLVSKTVLEANIKTDISKFLLVSRDKSNKKSISYKKTTVCTNTTNNYGFMNNQNKEMLRQQEFIEEITKTWDEINEETVTMGTSLKIDFSINSNMTTKAIKKAAEDQLSKIIKDEVTPLKDKMNTLSNERLFCGEEYQPLVHKDLISSMDDKSIIDIFAFVKAYHYRDDTKKHVARITDILSIPTGSDFNLKSIIALPSDEENTNSAEELTI